jgi:hypothetical protein
MLYYLLIESLDEKFKRKVLLQFSKYNIVVGGNNYVDGCSLLKVIIMLTYADTRATASHIRDTLVAATIKLEALNGNVEEFNTWIEEQVSKLAARGETCADLLTYLFNAYEAAPDATFRKYVKDKRDAYEDGEVDYTQESLMLLTKNKYNALVTKEQWGKATEEQEEIVALKAQLNATISQL